MQSVHWSGLFAFDVNIEKFWEHKSFYACRRCYENFFNYEKLLFVTMLPFGLFYAFVYFLQLFIAAIPQRHWCWVPELAHINKTYRHHLTAPGVAEGKVKWDKCHTYDVNWTRLVLAGLLVPPDPRTPLVPCPHGWEFELSDIPYNTVVSERGWVCQYAKYVPSAQVLFFSGTFVGGFLFGWMADRHGRLPALVGSNMIGCIGGIATIFTRRFWDYAFCRFLVGMSYDHLFMMMYILVIEYVGPGKRSFFANITTAVFYGAGCVSLPFLALWMGDWRKLLWLTSLPMLLVLIVPFILTESASWLLAKGQVTKTAEAVEKVNKPLKKLSENKLAEKKEPPPPPTIQESFRSALRRPPLRNTIIIMTFLFIASAIITCYIAVFGGLVRMSENLGLDFFTAFSLTSITEIPSGVFVALLMDRIGRRALTAGTLMISSALIVATMFLPNGLYVTILALSARLFVKMTYLTIIQWVTELLPTKVRALGSSIMHVLGSIAIAFSPYISPSRGIWILVPLFILAVMTGIAIAAAICLPETRNVKLPQTYAESERNVVEYTLIGYYKPEKKKKRKRKRKRKAKPIMKATPKYEAPETAKKIHKNKPTKKILKNKHDKIKEKKDEETWKEIKPMKIDESKKEVPAAVVTEEKETEEDDTEVDDTEVDDTEVDGTEEDDTEEDNQINTPPQKSLHDTPGALNLFRPL